MAKGGHVLQRGACVAKGACMVKWTYMAKGGCVWQEIRSTRGRYASYWNAFLLLLLFHLLTTTPVENCIQPRMNELKLLAFQVFTIV